jgi:hypothetical protein
LTEPWGFQDPWPSKNNWLYREYMKKVVSGFPGRISTGLFGRALGISRSPAI